MRVIAIANNKGGVGKTTTAQNIGAAIGTYSRGQRKVLIIDLDPQASLTKAFGIRLQDHTQTTGRFALREATLEQVRINYNSSNIDILPAATTLLSDEERIKASPQFPFNLKKALEQDKQQYDFVIIDCPPSLSALIKIALTACHRYCIPLHPEYLSYEGLREFILYANEIAKINPTVTLGGVFATRFNPKANKKFSNKLIDRASQQLGLKFLHTYIRENGDLYKAQARGQHIFDYNKASNGAIDYYNLTKELIIKP